MRKAGFCVVALVYCVSLVGVSAALGDAVQDVVNQISQANYTDTLNNQLYTHNGNDRGWGANHDQAQTNIYNAFVADGLTTSLSSFSYGGSTYYNVVGVKTGTVHPNDIYIVGAHYDSVSNPGADDNASGTAGVMEAARTMSQFTFEDTLIFIGFDREEQGMVGSQAYYAAHSTDNVKGMISLDMIAYNYPGTPNVAMLYGRTDPIQTALVGSLATYGITASKNGPLDASDQYAWDANGKPACLLIENHSANPFYHSQNDSVDSPGYIDYAYATNMTRGAVDFLATGAVVVPEPATLSILAFGAGSLLLRRRRAA